MLRLSSKWTERLLWLPETGMDYTIVTIRLNDGRTFEQAVIVGGQITMIRGLRDIPFTEEQIAEITATHAKWNFREP